MYELTRMQQRGLREQSAGQIEYGGSAPVDSRPEPGRQSQVARVSEGPGARCGVDPAIRGMRSGFRGVPVAVGD